MFVPIENVGFHPSPKKILKSPVFVLYKLNCPTVLNLYYIYICVLTENVECNNLTVLRLTVRELSSKRGTNIGDNIGSTSCGVLPSYLVYIASSSPPQLQNLLGNPFISSMCSGFIDTAPPK